MTGYFIPHTPGPHVIWEHAMKQFKKPEHAVRELVSNALDAKSKEVTVVLNKEVLSVEDWGHGILDPRDFAMYGSAAKEIEGRKTGEKSIGRMHFGKLSALRLKLSPSVEVEEAYRLNPEVKFLTFVPSKEMSYEITMSLKGNQVEEHGGAYYLDHPGTRVVIQHPLEEEVVSDVGCIKNHLSRAFGIKLIAGKKIKFNGEELEPKVGFDIGDRHDLYEQPHRLFMLKNGDQVIGNIWKDEKQGKGVVDVYINGVFVCELPIDQSRMFCGWINCDSLTPEISRSAVIEEPVFQDFIDKMRKYVSNFPMREEQHAGTSLSTKIIDDCTALMKDYLKDFGLMTKTNIPVVMDKKIRETGIIPKEYPRLGKTPGEGDDEGDDGSGSSSGGGGGGNEPHRHYKEKIHAQRKGDDEELKNRNHHEKKDFALRLIETGLGADKLPVVYEYPVTFYLNKDNEVYRFTVKHDRSLGPTWLRVTYLLSRSIIQMNPAYDQWRPEEVAAKTDEAMMYFIRKREGEKNNDGRL